MKSKLSDICSYVRERCLTSTLTLQTYVSTENMIPNKGGVTVSSGLPEQPQTSAFFKDDILVSNIRPYFKKIWMAEYNGGCSNDILVFRAKPGVDPRFLYFVLSNDAFFEYSTATSNGTKMPRGDKKAILEYPIPDFDIKKQLKVAALLFSIERRIVINKSINGCLYSQIQAIFDAYFPYGPSDTMPREWRKSSLRAVTTQLNERAKNNSYRVLSAVNSGELVYSDDYFTKQVFSKDIGKYICVPPRAFAYNPARVNIGSIGMNEFDETGCVSPVYVAFTVEKGYEEFFKLFIKRPLFKAEAETRSSGSVRQSMNYSDFGLIEIAYPPKALVQRFNESISPLLEAIKNRESESTSLAKARDELLPKLMSGEIDVDSVQLDQ